jgi:hypothetical protein
MTAAAHMVAIDDAAEGMLLSHDLLDDAGNVLLPAGATLSAVSLRSLRRRGIETLPVVADTEADGAPPDPAALAAERERRLARLAHLFRRSADVGATGRLLAQLLVYRNGA